MRQERVARSTSPSSPWLAGLELARSASTTTPRAVSRRWRCRAPDLDLSIAASSGSKTSATVTRGQQASYDLVFSGSAGFSGTLSLACTGVPSEATCTLNPPSVTLNGTTPAKVTANVTTRAPSGAVPLDVGPPGSGVGATRLRGTAPLLWLLALAMLAGVTATSRGRAAKTRLNLGVATLFVLLLVATVLPSCGGGGRGGGGGRNPGTPIGTYPLVVTGTFSSGSTILTHTINLTLTVTQ